LRDAGEQIVAIAKMPVGRGGADAGGSRGIGESEARRALFGDQPKRRLQQRLFQIAVMIAALASSCEGLLHEPGREVTSSRCLNSAARPEKLVREFASTKNSCGHNVAAPNAVDPVARPCRESYLATAEARNLSPWSRSSGVSASPKSSGAKI
jgi:hypothetical protein